MKTIDEEKLLLRREVLAAEIAVIDSMLDMVRQYGVDVPPTPTVRDLVQPSTRPSIKETVKTKTFTPGKRKAVTMALDTGPTVEKDIAALLGWSKSAVHEVVRNMGTAGLASEHNGQLFLTKEGKVQADWFRKHPTAMTYSPNAVANTQRNGTRH